MSRGPLPKRIVPHWCEGVRRSNGRDSTMGKPAALKRSRMRSTSMAWPFMLERFQSSTMRPPSSVTRLSGFGRSSLIRYQSKL